MATSVLILLPERQLDLVEEKYRAIFTIPRYPQLCNSQLKQQNHVVFSLLESVREIVRAPLAALSLCPAYT